MVQLSIDPPPFGGRGASSGGGSSLLRPVAYLVVLLLVAGGAFYAGRKTAPREGPGPEVAAAPAPNAGPRGAAPPPAPAPTPGTPAATPAPGGATAAAPAPGSAAAPGAVAAQPPAAATPPGAPQGPLVRRVSVTLKGPLEESMQAAMPPEERAWATQLTQVVNRLLVWSLQISRDGRKGDKLDVLYELPTAQPSEVQAVGEAGPVTKEPVVLALRYGSQKLGKLITAYRFKPEGAAFARYYTSDGTDVEQHLVDGPIDTWEQVTSLLRDGRRHKGVDYKAPVGTPVKSPFDGTITRRNWHFSANGNCLEIVGAGGKKAIFLHLEAVAKEMQPGRKVRKGEVVAKSGNSGHSTAPHLHYQLEDANGKVLDPFVVHATTQVKLQGPARAAFDQERGRLEPMLLTAAR
jgi:hypothetical protein